MNFLVDECLHKGPGKVAHAAGCEAHQVVDLGRAGTKDYELGELIVKQQIVFLSNNAKDFKQLPEKIDLPPELVIMCPTCG